MSDAEIKVDKKKLDQLVKAFSGRLPVAKVGILGDKNARNDENTNAAIGLKHEFGDHEVPQRSFLRIPIADNLQKYLENSMLLSDKNLEEVIKTGNIVQMMEKLGLVGVTIVLDGFATGGFGKWKPHAKGYENNTGMILVDTTQLRNSIMSQVSETE